jgi:hypothetical protein
MRIVQYRVDATAFGTEMQSESAAVRFLNDQPNVVYSIRNYPVSGWYVRIEGYGWLKESDE